MLYIMLQDYNHKIILRSHQYFMSCRLQPEEGQAVGGVKVTHDGLGLLCQVSNHVAVLGRGVEGFSFY